MGVPKEMFNRVTEGDEKCRYNPIGDGASDVEDALLAPSEAGSSAPVSRDQSPLGAITPRRRVRPPRIVSKPHDVRGLADRRVGVRAVRRKQNNQFLLTLIEEEEEGLPELRDHPTVPAFTKLFLEKKNMMAWSDFISLSEDKQEEYLKELNCVGSSEAKNKPKRPSEVETGWEVVNSPSTEETIEIAAAVAAASGLDGRSLHPATPPVLLSPEECFERVEMRFRAMLRKRHIPLGILANLEEDLTSFFSECPRSVWVSRLSSSYERLLLHALCQYLDLKSSSFDRDEARHTQVENQHMAFSPPKKTLCQHLEDMRLESNCSEKELSKEEEFKKAEE